MKKVFMLFALICASTLFTYAQSECNYFLPTKKGTEVINKSYDARNNLISTAVYKVDDSFDNINGSGVDIKFTMLDGNNVAYDHGNVAVRCDDGTFYMKMVNTGIAPEMMASLYQDIELSGDFLDYPNTFNPNFPLTGDLSVDDASFTIRSKKNKDDNATAHVYNRKYEGTEKVTTPAGTFDAAKVTYMVDVTNDNNTKTYKGTEWYCPNAGIVRAETHDDNGSLLTYSELTTLKEE